MYHTQTDGEHAFHIVRDRYAQCLLFSVKAQTAPTAHAEPVLHEIMYRHSGKAAGYTQPYGVTHLSLGLDRCSYPEIIVERHKSAVIVLNQYLKDLRAGCA